MDYELALALKKAGFRQFGDNSDNPRGYLNLTGGHTCSDGDSVYLPALSELIEACGKEFWKLENTGHKCWQAWSKPYDDKPYSVQDPTPEEAVARLWLALNKKP